MSAEPQTPDPPQPPETPPPSEEPAPASGAQEGAPPAGQRRRPAFVAALPFLATAVAAVLVSLLAQAMLWPRPPAAVPTLAANPTAQQPPTAAPAATAPPATSPAPTTTGSEDRVLSLQILDLEAENRRLWSAVFLLRAASQLDDSITALEGNDIAEADRTLLAVYRSLDQAYDFSAEQEKGPIDTFRLELSSIRDDLRVRPEGADRRLRQLRQLMLSLVDEGD